MSTSFTIPSIFTAIDKFSAPMKNMSRSVNAFVGRTEVAMARVERAYRRILSPLTSIRAAMNNIGYYVGIYTFINIIRNAYNVLADFEQSLVNISAVTKKSVKDNKAYADQAREISLRYGLAASKVADLQFELEKLGGLDVLKITEPILAGATALNLPADKFGALVGSVIKTFPELESMDAMRIVDQMVTVADKTAVAGEDFETFLRSSMGAAVQAKRPFTELLAMMGVLRNEAIQMASGGTASKNLFIDSQILQGGKKDWKQILEQAMKSERVLKKVRDYFGRRTAVSAISLGDSIGEMENLQKLLESDSIEGSSMRRAMVMLDSMRGNAKLATASYEEFILSMDDGTNVFSKTIRRTQEIVRAMFLLSSGSDMAKKTLGTMDKSIISSAENWLFLSKTVIFIVKWMLIAKVVIWAVNLAIGAYNIALGLSVALGWSSIFVLRGSALAMGTYKVAMWVATAATWAFNAALTFMAAHPVIAAIILLTTIIAAIVTHWNEWGAAISMVMGQFGFLISLVQAFRRNWDLISEAFSTGGLIGALKAIGATIFDALLMPLQQAYKLIANMPFLPLEWTIAADQMVKNIDFLRERSGVNVGTDENGNAIERPKLNTQKVKEEFRSEIEKTTTNRAVVDFINVPRGTNVKGNRDLIGAITPRLDTTMGF